jgi:hypothetical protein
MPSKDRAEARHRRAWTIVTLVVAAIAIVVWWGRGGARRDATTTSSSNATMNAAAANNANANAQANAGDNPIAATTPKPASTTNVFAKEKWGSGLDELGKLTGKESNPEAPMSLAPGANGAVVVLDQVNGRLVTLGPDGKPIRETRTSLAAPQDVAVAKDGSTAVLDRLGDKSIQILGPDGKVLGALPVEGKGIGEGGAVTGVFVDGDKVYVEREHQQLVLVGDTSGRPSDARTEIPGRPTRDGQSYLTAWIDTPPTTSFYVTSTQREPESHRFTRQVTLMETAIGLLLLDTDRAGVIYVGALGEASDGTQSIVLVCLEPAHGEIMGETTLPPSTMPEETFRTLMVQDSGGVLYALPTEGGEEILRADCRGT